MNKRQREHRRRFRRKRRRNRKEAFADGAPLSHEQYLQRLKRIAERQRSLQAKLAMLSRRQQSILERVTQAKDVKPVLRSRRSVEQSLKTLQEVDEEDRVGVAEEDRPKRRVRRAATAYKSRTWPYGVIPYVIQANFTSKSARLCVRLSGLFCMKYPVPCVNNTLDCPKAVLFM